MRHRILAGVIAITGVAALALSGCSSNKGSETSSSGSSSSSASATAAPTTEVKTDCVPDKATAGATPVTTPMKIGTLLPETGSLAFLGPPMIAGVKVAVDDVNAAGGVLGSPCRAQHRRFRRHDHGHRQHHGRPRARGRCRRDRRRCVVGRLAEGDRQDRQCRRGDVLAGEHVGPVRLLHRQGHVLPHRAHRCPSGTGALAADHSGRCTARSDPGTERSIWHRAGRQHGQGPRDGRHRLGSDQEDRLRPQRPVVQR